MIGAYRRSAVASDRAESDNFFDFVKEFRVIFEKKPESQIPRRKTSYPVLREEVGFPANEATEVRGTPSPRMTPDLAGNSRFKSLIK